MNLLTKLYQKLKKKFSVESLSEYKSYSKVDKLVPKPNMTTIRESNKNSSTQTNCKLYY